MDGLIKRDVGSDVRCLTDRFNERYVEFCRKHPDIGSTDTIHVSPSQSGTDWMFYNEDEMKRLLSVQDDQLQKARMFDSLLHWNLPNEVLKIFDRQGNMWYIIPYYEMLNCVRET